VELEDFIFHHFILYHVC